MFEKRTKDTGGERNIDVLLETYAGEVAELRAACGRNGVVLEDGLHDEIFLLRFLLSWGTVDASAKAVEDAIAYRKENASWLPDGASTGLEDELMGFKDEPWAASLKQYLPRSAHGTTKEGDIVILIRAGIMQMSKLFTVKAPEGALTKLIVFANEVVHLHLDAVTRSTRRLTKVLVINDAAGLSMASIDSRFFKALGAASKISDTIHPQQTWRTVVTNPPVVIRTLMKAVRPFMSKKSFEKMVLCTASRPWGLADINRCPFATQTIPIKDIPTYLGGECDCVHQSGCCRGHPNEISKKRVSTSKNSSN